MQGLLACRCCVENSKEKGNTRQPPEVSSGSSRFFSLGGWRGGHLIIRKEDDMKEEAKFIGSQLNLLSAF